MKINMVQAKTFMRELFSARKIVRKANKAENPVKDSLIKISDEFMPEEYNHIVGNNYTKIANYTSKQNLPFRAELLPDTRNAILNMGSRSIYVDMAKTSPQEMDKIVTDLLRHPYKV